MAESSSDTFESVLQDLLTINVHREGYHLASILVSEKFSNFDAWQAFTEEQLVTSTANLLSDISGSILTCLACASPPSLLDADVQLQSFDTYMKTVICPGAHLYQRPMQAPPVANALGQNHPWKKGCSAGCATWSACCLSRIHTPDTTICKC